MHKLEVDATRYNTISVGRVELAKPISVNLRNETLVGGVSNPDFMERFFISGLETPPTRGKWGRVAPKLTLMGFASSIRN